MKTWNHSVLQYEVFKDSRHFKMDGNIHYENYYDQPLDAYERYLSLKEFHPDVTFYTTWRQRH